MVIGLGDSIRNKRKQLGLTQEDLAELSNLSVNFISRIERTNNQNISLQKLDAIAKALNTSLIELIKPIDKNITDTFSSEQDGYFLNKLITELKKFPQEQTENISKHLFYIIKSIKSEN